MIISGSYSLQKTDTSQSEPSGGTTQFTSRGHSFPRAIQRLRRVLWYIALDVTDVCGSSLVFLKYTARTEVARDWIEGIRTCLERRGKAMMVERYFRVKCACSCSLPLSINIGLCSDLLSQSLSHIAFSDTHFRTLYAASRL